MAEVAGGEGQQAALIVITAPGAAEQEAVITLERAPDGLGDVGIHPGQLGAELVLQDIFACGQVGGHVANGTLRSMPGLLSPMRALVLGGIGLLCQVVALLPPIDNAVDTNAAIHYLQHGIIFAGGLCMGIALRDLLVMSRRAGG